MEEELGKMLVQNAPVWCICLYVLGKEVAAYFKTRAASRKKDAESLRQQSIDETLKKVGEYLKILADKQNKEITRDQAETVVISLIKEKAFEVSRHILFTLEDNNIDSNKRSVKDRLKMFFDTLGDSLVNKLGRFSYKESSLLLIYDPILISEMEDMVTDFILSDKRNEPKAYSTLMKLVDNKFNSIKGKLINKL